MTELSTPQFSAQTNGQTPVEKRSGFPFYPALFICLPILKVWECCLGNYMPEQFLSILAVLIVTTLAFQAVAFASMKNTDKAGILTLGVIATIFCWPLFRGISQNHLSDLTEAAIYLLLCLNACNFAVRKLSNRMVTTFLNLASLSIITVVIPIVQGELAQQNLSQKSLELVRKEFAEVAPYSQSKPDIYYIVVDAFANQHTLQDQYQYNSTLIKHLKQRGFFIADESYANHDRTALSIPSSVNMRYMTDVLNEPHPFSTVEFFRLLQNNQVAHLLKGLDYRFINVCSGWEPTHLNPYADVNEAAGPGCNLEITLLRLTVFEPFGDRSGLLAQVYRSSRMRCFEQADQIASARGPKFVMIHTLICHPPFFLNSRGETSELSTRMMNEPYTKQAYLEQLKFGENEVVGLIDKILSEAKQSKPIIIVQSDHGPASNEAGFNTNYVNERMRILNAFYLGEPNNPVHPPVGITPVNSFRWILNRYFGTNLPMLENHAFAAVPFENGPHKEVTDLITFPRQLSGKNPIQ